VGEMEAVMTEHQANKLGADVLDKFVAELDLPSP
jgi:hypothetical protein